MWVSKNKTRQTLTPVAIQKPVKEWIELRDGIFVSLEDGYIIPATSSTIIEWCATNDIYNKAQIKEPSAEWFDRMCIYFPKRYWETFTIEVENGELTQEDVGQTFLITWELQHINYSTKAPNGWQFRLEQVINPTVGEFTYYFESALSPQWPQWEKGDTPTFTFSPVETLPTGSQAWAVVHQDGLNYDITFQIPAWANGADGENGGKWPKGEDGDTIDLRIGTVTWWQTAAADITTATPTMRELNLTLPKGEDGQDGLTPTPRGNWSASRTYNYLDIVRHNDPDGIGCTWIWKDRTRPATASDIPWETDSWMLLVSDGANGEQGEPGGTIVVPVEWKPWKDGVPGADGERGLDGKSPHNEWDWEDDEAYTELAMVRATTGEYDPRGNEIFWYYITQGGVPAGDDQPKDNPYRQLVSKDWMAWYGNIYSAMVFIADPKTITGTVPQSWWIEPSTRTWSHFTGNRDMVMWDWQWIVITRTGHYEIKAHAIVLNNGTSNKILNLWRISVLLKSSRNGSPQTYWLGTAKSGWPYTTEEWPWLDLDVNINCDLYEWDVIALYYRPSTGVDNPWGRSYQFTLQWTLDPSWDVSAGYQWGLFSTYLWANLISRKLRQSDTWFKLISSI